MRNTADSGQDSWGTNCKSLYGRSKRKGWGAHRQTGQDRSAPHSVLREFLRSAQAAERGPKPKRNFRIGRPEASPSCASSLEAQRVRRAPPDGSGLLRAALRFARASSKRTGRRVRP